MSAEAKDRSEPRTTLKTWPWQAAKPTTESSAINCAVMLLRHLNKEILDFKVLQAENERNLIQKASIEKHPLVGKEVREKLHDDLKACGLIKGDIPPTFADLAESEQMLATTWSRAEQHLFRNLKKIGEEDWQIDEEFERQYGARQSVVKIDESRCRGRLDIAALIEGQSKISPITEEPGCYRFPIPRPPQHIRVQYTPRADDQENISSLQSFKMKLLSAPDTQAGAVDPRDEREVREPGPRVTWQPAFRTASRPIRFLVGIVSAERTKLPSWPESRRHNAQ
ncbi:hypothetical protein N0V92_011230 [Colletotrichum tropicale]|nr:hypothetical protein N0V92_011230 [Colletotrichum tropicale]